MRGERVRRPANATYTGQRRRVMLDAFQTTFAAYLARSVHLDDLRGVVRRCVMEARDLAQIFQRSFGAALDARCLCNADYMTLISDLTQFVRPPEPVALEKRVLNHRFELQEKVADGGIGRLYRGIDLQCRDAPVAVKMLNEALRDCPDALNSLAQESVNARQLDHPNIRRVHALDRCDDDFFITLEWLDGESLATRLDRTGSRPMPLPAARQVLAGIGAGLHHAHTRGIVHGDVKPANVFVTVAGHVKLLDFGQVRLPFRHDAAKQAISPAYASCEMHEGAEPVVADDVFAVAVMAYRILTGVRPFGHYTALAAERAGIRILRPGTLGAAQWRVLRQGLAYRREQRPAGVLQLVDGLSCVPPRRPGARREPTGVAA